MTQTDEQKKAMAKYQREKCKMLTIRLNLDDHAEIVAYCQAQGIGTTELLRRAIWADMIAHGWQRDGWKKEIGE